MSEQALNESIAWLRRSLERIEKKVDSQADEIVKIREQLAEAKGAVKGGKALVGLISGIAASAATMLAAWLKQGGTQ